MKRYEFTLTGLTPLIIHADDVMGADLVDEWQKDPAHKNVSRAGDDRQPAWKWRTYLYSDGEVLTVPADNLMVCLRAAGAEVTMSGRKTFKAATQTGLLIESEHMPLLCGGKTISVKDIEAIDSDQFRDHLPATEKLGFRLFVKRAKVGSSKHVRVRPRFDDWSLKGEILVAAVEFTEDKLRQIFEIAGLKKGLCDWRPASPQSPGPFGRYSCELREIK